MYRPVCSQLMLIVLIALQVISGFRAPQLLLAQEYSVEERIHIDHELYVGRDANGAGLYTARVERFTTTKSVPLANKGGGQQQNYHQQHTNQASEQQLQQALHDQNYYDQQHYLMQQQQQLQAQHHHQHQLQEQQQQVQTAQHQQQPHYSDPGQQQDHRSIQPQQQAQPQPSHHQLHNRQPNDQYEQQQVPEEAHNHESNNIHAGNNEARQQQHYHELQHSHQLPLQHLYRQHHQQLQSHIQQITTHFEAWRSESIHETGATVGISVEVMHNFETTYPIVGHDHLAAASQHHQHNRARSSSCDSIDDSSILLMPNHGHYGGQPTCEATSASRYSRGTSDHHVPHFPAHPNNNKRNSNVESFPLAPQHYHYDSSLMTAIRHYWREISALCLVTAIFLNWLFVVIKRRFIASGLTRSHMTAAVTDIAAAAPSEQLVESLQQQRLSTSSSTASPPKSISKDTTSTFNNSAHDSAFEENNSPISLDDADDTSQESSLSSRPRSVSSTPFRPNGSQHNCSINSSSGTSDYISRYSSDFDSIRRLGRGGFGIVFEAKNKIDDCHYAVKRICLPLEKEARERVMREVRALAKLDHAGIVRYYNAWLETPPDEWLKQHDALLGIVHTRDGLSFPSTDGICEKNNTNGFNISDKFGESGDISNLDYYGNTKSPFDTKRRGYNSSNYLKENSSSPSLDIVFEGSGSIRLEAENNTEESNEINKQQITNASSGLQLEKVYLYIQMQLCRKDTLKDWLRTNCENRDKTTIFDFFYQIVDAVEYVHSQDLIHRDLKPSNIFFSLDGTLKIGDFGLCRAKTNTCVGSSLDLKEYAADFSDAVHTEQVGTQLYMSPEQMNGLSYNHKVDIFAMGLILLELLIPFKTQMQRVNVLAKARTNMFSRDFIRDHPDEHDLVRSLLDRRPHKRPTASAIKEHDLLANAQLSQPVIERIYHRRRTISSNSSSE